MIRTGDLRWSIYMSHYLPVLVETNCWVEHLPILISVSCWFKIYQTYIHHSFDIHEGNISGSILLIIVNLTFALVILAQDHIYLKLISSFNWAEWMSQQLINLCISPVMTNVRVETFWKCAHFFVWPHFEGHVTALKNNLDIPHKTSAQSIIELSLSKKWAL